MVAGMAWSEEEDLVIVGATTGQAHVFALDAFLEAGSSQVSSPSSPCRTLTLGADAAREGVAAVAFWGDGLVAMTKRGALVALDGFAEPRVEPLPSPLVMTSGASMTTGASSTSTSTSSPPTSSPLLFTTTSAPPLAVLPPAASPTGSPRAITAVGRDLYVCDARSGAKVKATMGAAVDKDARLVVWSSDFGRALSEFATQAASVPDALAWCGSDSVVMLWKSGGGVGGMSDFASSSSSSTGVAPFTTADSSSDPTTSSHSLMLMVGPFGDWVKYDAAGVAAVSTEPDGLRILSSTKSDLLRRVPDALADALRPGSTAGSAALRDARRALDGGHGGPNSNGGGALGALRALRRKALPGAAVAAADAARAAVKFSTQEELLKAAALGVAFALGGGTTMVDEDEDEEDEDEDKVGGEHEEDDDAADDGEEGSQKKKSKPRTQAAATRAAAAAVAAAISEIRVLRAAREVRSSCSSDLSSPLALPITSRQLELLGPVSLVGRLARRGHHLLALRAAGALGCPGAAAAGVAAHWAAAAISSADAAGGGESDESLASKVRRREREGEKVFSFRFRRRKKTLSCSLFSDLPTTLPFFFALTSFLSNLPPPPNINHKQNRSDPGWNWSEAPPEGAKPPKTTRSTASATELSPPSPPPPAAARSPRPSWRPSRSLASASPCSCASGTARGRSTPLWVPRTPT